MKTSSLTLITNENSHVEIIVQNRKAFLLKYSKEIESLKNINNNFLIRKAQYKLNNNVLNTYRFFEKPIIKSEYTYIADIDIMFLDNLLPKYKANWLSNLCYNNILRQKNKLRLTGVHMVKTDKYYNNKFLQIQKKYYDKNKNKNDECILAEMCKEIHGLPNFNHRFRPILGIHFSPNRGKNKKMVLATNNKYYNKFMFIKNEYPKLFEYDIFKKLVNQLNNEFIIPKKL